MGILRVMIYLIGDIHGDFWSLKNLLHDIPPEATVVQVGDFGIWPALASRWKTVGIDRDVCFIDGNHDYIPWLDANSPEPVEIWPHAIYLPRGHVVEVEGQRWLFSGGSKSIDRLYRRKDSMNHGWFEAEELTSAQAERMIAHGPVDVMITHTPPDSVIRRNFPPGALEAFGHNPEKWIDESARLIEKVWNAVGQPKLFCGHMHKNLTDGQVRILDTNEVLKVGNS